MINYQYISSMLHIPVPASFYAFSIRYEEIMCYLSVSVPRALVFTS